MEREACVCDHGYERSDLCAEIIIIIIITNNIGGKRSELVKTDRARKKLITKPFSPLQAIVIFPVILC